MKLHFYLDEDEKVVPIKVADALIECGAFENVDLEEIAGHLNVYCHKQNIRDMAKTYAESEMRPAELGGKA